MKPTGSGLDDTRVGQLLESQGGKMMHEGQYPGGGDYAADRESAIDRAMAEGLRRVRAFFRMPEDEKDDEDEVDWDKIK